MDQAFMVNVSIQFCVLQMSINNESIHIIDKINNVVMYYLFAKYSINYQTQNIPVQTVL